MTVKTEYGADILKQTQAMAEMVKDMMPKVTTNKNGFEIRTKVLEFAQNQTWQDYHAKFAGYETTVARDGDNVVTKVEVPEVPGADAVLETAQKFYDFVQGKR